MVHKHRLNLSGVFIVPKFNLLNLKNKDCDNKFEIIVVIIYHYSIVILTKRKENKLNTLMLVIVKMCITKKSQCYFNKSHGPSLCIIQPTYYIR